LVIGGGIFGLSVAYSLKMAGARVKILEAGAIAGGASGGVVGALCPHAPTRWRPFKQFQLEALLALPDRISRIEAESGRNTGYARTGRITPLITVKDRKRAEGEIEGARDVWGNAADFSILDETPAHLKEWLAPDAAPAGLVQETLSARVDPRAYVQAIAACLGDQIDEGVQVTKLLAQGQGVETVHGTLRADHIVIAAGWRSWDLTGALASGLQGQPVKGQAAILECKAGKMPLLYVDGLYVIPHSAGRVAIGSTSEKGFSDLQTDARLETLIETARRAIPCLRNTPVIERWAGLRPKPPGREPVVGPLPDRPDIWLATGGFKISFGIAHAIGDAVAAGIMGTSPKIHLPETFDPAGLLATR